MRELLQALNFYFINPVMSLLLIVLLVYVVMGWLIIGGVVSRHNPTAHQIYRFLESIIGPMLRPLRRIIPPLGQLDLSVFALALILIFARDYAIPRLISLVPV